ncbi:MULTISPECIES: peptidoglycan-binding domain-containing protein [Lysobacter]|uniref:peptidoglycan-binding domain-containing protein n=1 Tax=Lysobacter TaxID=68 RepID=UPI001F31ED73|nr:MULTISPECIES: peptidoglycan-binding domain-containing protein [Lysobacter]UJB21247.1 peptidoglycan-binding protein [Lysobacter capsici]UJQ29637.1 peptidoglycan-binding protein [Lysobacter gummosus]
MPKYTIVESVDKKNTIEHIHDLGDIERHHPSRGNESGRVYGTVNGEREELLGNYAGKATVSRDGDHYVSKDFILQSGNMKSVPVPSVANGYIGKIDPANGIVQLYDKPATDPSREMIAQYRHLDLRGTKLEVGDKVEYGQPLAPQGGFNKGNPKAFGPHVHIDINASYLPQMDRYIRDMDNGTISTDKRPPHSENLTAAAKVTDVSGKGTVTHTAPGGGAHHDKPHAAPMADGTLRKDEHGPEVKALQEKLSQLGYKDADGKPLVADGKFGQRTKDAVEAFQRDHHLKEDGIAGKDTLKALKTAQPKHADAEPTRSAEPATRGPLLSDAAHPDNAMYKQAVGGLEKLGGFKNHQELERAAATLTYDARVSGLTKIDHVVPNASGTGLFAVQGGLNDPSHQRAFVDRAQATQQSVEQSTQKLQQDAPKMAEPAQAQQQARTMVA